MRAEYDLSKLKGRVRGKYAKRRREGMNRIERTDGMSKRVSGYDAVHTITDWYDGARSGVADLNGEPHYFENHWNEGEQYWSEIYLLQPLDAETFALAIEDWEIWLRWEHAFKEGKTTQETHPALPEDRERHNEIENILAERLVVSPDTGVKATAEFHYGQPTKVKWHPVEGSI